VDVLARYANSELASTQDKQWIQKKLGAIGRRLEKYNFSIKAAGGVTESHVGFSWKGFRNNHVSILIPTVYSLYKGTADEHWLKLHDELLAERDGLRWQRLHAGARALNNKVAVLFPKPACAVGSTDDFLGDERRFTVSRLGSQEAF